MTTASDRIPLPQVRDLLQQFAHCLSVHDRRVGHGDQLTGDGIPRPRFVEPLSSRRRTHEETPKRPQAAQERAEHAMGRIDEEHVAVPGLGRVQCGPQLVVEKRRLIGGVFRETFFGGTGRARTRCHFSPRPFRNRDT